MITLGDPKLQVKIFEEILEQGYSVRKVEEIVKSLNEGETVKGKISIPFGNEEELERIIGILDTLKNK